MVSLLGSGHWQQRSEPDAPVRSLGAPEQCPNPTTTEQNKIWGWTNSCRISGSFIQIAHFPCFFLSLSPPLLDPWGSHHSKHISERERGGRERETNKQRERLSGKHGGVVTQLKKGGREKETAVLRVIMRGKLAKSGSPHCLTDTRWQRFAVQLLSLAYLLYVIDFLLLNNRPSRIVCVYVCIWLGWWWREVQDGGTANPRDPPLHPPPPPPVPVLWSEQSRGSLELKVLNQVVGPRGEFCLSVWNFIILNYLDHDRSRSPSLPLPPFHLVTQTQAFLTQPCLSVCLPLCFLPFPCAASPLLITPINIFNFCHFPPSALFPSVSVSFFCFTLSRAIHHKFPFLFEYLRNLIHLHYNISVVR